MQNDLNKQIDQNELKTFFFINVTDALYRVAENLSLHWHTQKGTRASLGPLPASLIVKLPSLLPQKHASQMPTLHTNVH